MRAREIVVCSEELNVALATGKVFKHASVTHYRAQMTALQLHVAHTPATAILEFLEIQWNRNLRQNICEDELSLHWEKCVESFYLMNILMRCTFEAELGTNSELCFQNITNFVP